MEKRLVFTLVSGLSILLVSPLVLLFVVLLLFKIFIVTGLDENYSASMHSLNQIRDNPSMVEPNTREFIPQILVHSGSPIGQITGSPESTFLLRWPVIDGLGYVTQCYFKYPESGGYKDIEGEHNGIDIAYYSYPEILAAAPGVVHFAGCLEGECPEEGAMKEGGTGLAYAVMLRHDNGYFTVYGHLNTIYVEVGESVVSGQVIGQMGKTGTVDGEVGVHLHFSLLKNENWEVINPAPYFEREVCTHTFMGEDSLEDSAN